MKALVYVEVDIDYCSRTFGVAPCTASLSNDPFRKCFNSTKTCQDRENFNDETATLRFSKAHGYLPSDIDCIPSIVGVSYSGAVISLGEDLGQRATVQITFGDHPHSDTGPGGDKYLSDRTYNPFELGSFWGKFRARHPFVRGKPLRLIMGYVGQTLAQMETRHFLVDSFEGPDPKGNYSLVAKDVLKLADDDRSQAPRLSNGFLLADINSSTTAATLTPNGIGNLEYPASGYVNIGGKEICSFTRSGDALTLVRGRYNTTAIAHTAEERIQLCLRYVAADPADIIYDLFTGYSEIDAAYINQATWQLETATYLQRVYTTLIAEPTGVNQLVSELVQQAALAIWGDELNQNIPLQVLRAISTDAATFGDDSARMAGSLSVKEQPNKRISQVWVYFAQRDPTQPLENEDNYKSCVRTYDATAESDYGSASIKKIYSRWIPEFGRSIAGRLGSLLLGRYRDPPRGFTFDVFRSPIQTVVPMGAGYKIANWSIQDDTGAPSVAPIQITRIRPESDRWVVEAEEMLWTDNGVIDNNDRVITIDTNTYNFNLKTVHDSLYPLITDITGITVTCIIYAGVRVGSASTSTPAFNVGTGWPVGLPIKLVCMGRIQGHGGNGGPGGGYGDGLPGSAGGPALYVRFPIELDNTGGQIWGGGGGGGGSSGAGGGGAGDIAGAGAVNNWDPGNAMFWSNSGGLTSGGNGGGLSPYRGGNGGGPGLAGATSDGGGLYGSEPGGAAGRAVDGISYITVLAAGDRRGPEVN